MSFPTANVAAPALSPSLNEYGEAILTDENSKLLELLVLVPVDANGHSNLGAAPYANGHVSGVTNRRQSAVVTTPGGNKIRAKGIMSIDTSGNPIPFSAPSAVSVSGKFQSAERTATGSAESIAHGLGVVPSLVLVSIQDSNGVALPFSIVEGTHTTTNIVVTVTASLKYKVIAFA